MDTPKRPKTAWGLFLEDHKRLCASEVGGGIGKFNELQKAASSRWKEMTAQEKEPWVNMEKANHQHFVQSQLSSDGAAARIALKSKKKKNSNPREYRRAFQYFVNEHRDKNPLYWSLFTFNQAQKELSTIWNAMSHDEKHRWFAIEKEQNKIQNLDERLTMDGSSFMGTGGTLMALPSSGGRILGNISDSDIGAMENRKRKFINMENINGNFQLVDGHIGNGSYHSGYQISQINPPAAAQHAASSPWAERSSNSQSSSGQVQQNAPLSPAMRKIKIFKSSSGDQHNEYSMFDGACLESRSFSPSAFDQASLNYFDVIPSIGSSTAPYFTNITKFPSTDEAILHTDGFDQTPSGHYFGIGMRDPAAGFGSKNK